MINQKTIIKVAIIILGTHLITSCAVQRLSSNEFQSVNKVAILSELDDQMNKVLIGVTRFDNESTQSSVKAMNINRSIENDIAQKLWSTGKEVVILQTSIDDIMQEKNKLRINQKNYKGADAVIIVKPTYQIENYPLFPEGYGVYEKDTLGLKHRMLYASIVYEIYSTKDGKRKAYYIVHPEGTNVIKLDSSIPFNQLTASKMLEYKPQVDALFDEIDSTALKNMGLV